MQAPNFMAPVNMGGNIDSHGMFMGSTNGMVNSYLNDAMRFKANSIQNGW